MTDPKPACLKECWQNRIHVNSTARNDQNSGTAQKISYHSQIFAHLSLMVNEIVKISLRTKTFHIAVVCRVLFLLNCTISQLWRFIATVLNSPSFRSEHIHVSQIFDFTGQTHTPQVVSTPTHNQDRHLGWERRTMSNHPNELPTSAYDVARSRSNSVRSRLKASYEQM